ncbi:MAG: hypothetical protein EU529_03725 [Promethearchaeota archaeon]|nr:MAG: hypothetical protein EU529_03725 [Candidatus Lokiarchaeota archaeon]
MKKIKCSKCGTRIETIPEHCGKDMIFNEKKNQWECFMGPECGYVSLDEILCSKCSEEQCFT